MDSFVSAVLSWTRLSIWHWILAMGIIRNRISRAKVNYSLCCLSTSFHHLTTAATFLKEREHSVSGVSWIRSDFDFPNPGLGIESGPRLPHFSNVGHA